MFVRVDDSNDSGIEGFSYMNRYGLIEKVEINDDHVYVQDSTDDKVCIYTPDIPLLIKALQAAYDHIQKGK